MEGENLNIEVAHHLGEHGSSESAEHRRLELIEAVVLAIIAITTSWAGYQAALWNGHQAELYGVASKLRVQAEGAQTAANQERLYIASTVSAWLNAEAHKDSKLAEVFERRILPEFRPAFERWKALDPINNADAPPGPIPTDYRTSMSEESTKLNNQATETFDQGNVAREHSDQYVRLSVTLATLLLLVTVSQRFKVRVIRMGLIGIVLVLLCFPIYRIFALPRF
jgi:hypothetical protein